MLYQLQYHRFTTKTVVTFSWQKAKDEAPNESEEADHTHPGGVLYTRTASLQQQRTIHGGDKYWLPHPHVCVEVVKNISRSSTTQLTSNETNYFFSLFLSLHLLFVLDLTKYSLTSTFVHYPYKWTVSKFGESKHEKGMEVISLVYLK